VDIKNISADQKYFHCYATANDSHLYLKDLQNLTRLKHFYSGFGKIELLIAISKVKPINAYDRHFVKMIKKMFDQHTSIIVNEIFFKSNVGRDFSSFQSLFQKVKITANANDYIFFQNRSGFGPFRENWYQQFVHQFEKFDAIALCGSTINFSDNPKRSLRDDMPHIQTYAFLSKIEFMDLLGDPFPGATETEKLKIICNGEIALSQFFLNKEYKITCIEWPDKVISNDSKPIESLDIKRKVTAQHAFYHREYFKRNIPAKFAQWTKGINTWIKFLNQERKNK
jgi:hypothetical protein